MATESKPNLDELKKLEDEVRERLDAWDDLRRATAYLYLNASGLSLEKAHTLRRKAGATQ